MAKIAPLLNKKLEDSLPRERLRGVPDPHGARYASGTLWPHGEWSYGYGRERPDGGDWHEEPFQAGPSAEAQMQAHSRIDRAALDLSAVPNSCKWPRRGTKGMSGFGAQMVKAAGHLLQQQYPHHRKTLGTITLPPMSDSARREVVELWPVLTNQLLTWLSRRLQRQGLPPACVSVTEIQSKRLAECGEGSLHWHLLWLNQPGKKGNWAVDPCDVRAWLEGVLQRRIPSYTGGHINVDTRPVEGTVAAYMAKYMSKGKQAVQDAMTDWGHGLCPRTWWNMTSPLRKAVKDATVKGRAVGAFLERVVYEALDANIDEYFHFLRPIRIDFDGVEVLMGWRGRFTEELDAETRYVLASSDIG